MTALESEGQRRAYVTHAVGPQLRNPTAQAVPGDRHHVVQVDCARLFHSILGPQGHLGRNTTDRRGDGGHRDSGEVA